MPANARPTTRLCLAALAAATTLAPNANAQQVSYENVGGVRYQVTRQTVQHQVPVTVMRDQQQTVYAPQNTTNTIRRQQLYSVPITEYKMVSKLRGRWNPFVKPYWTHRLEPVTRWQQQVATVEIPVTQTSWVPQVRTVQVPATEMRTEQREIVRRVAMGPASTGLANAGQPAATADGWASVSTRGATIAAVPTGPVGGIAMKSDPPRRSSGWREPNGQSYRPGYR